MQIDKVTVAIRPRENWEAADLGYRMVQHWWKAIYGPWLIITLSVAGIIFYVSWELHQLWLYVLLVWWFKPIFSRIPLFVLSRTVFGQQMTTRQTLRALPRIFMISPLWRLLFMRLSLLRSFDLPVVILEGLKGKERRERMRVLRRNSAGTIVWLTISFFLFQIIVYFTLLAVIAMIIPPDAHVQWYHVLFPFASEVSLVWKLTGLISYTCAIVALEPFYIGAGFALYLNRRTLLEAWDIEIAFHRMVDRFHPAGGFTKVAMLALLLSSVFFAAGLVPSPVHASNRAPDTIQAKNQIETILQSAEFNHKEVRSYYRFKQRPSVKTAKKPPGKNFSWLFESFAEFFAVMFKAVLLILCLMLIIWLVVNHERWLGWIRGVRPAPKISVPQQLFGLDIRPESLPEDIANQALALWRAGKPRLALSLLYRGALSRLATRDAVALKESFTEGDCLGAVTRVVGSAKSHYFTQLTRAWQFIAYANRVPDNGEALCKQYSTHFEATA
ncbi:MAG: DUF4129 domain-containing protein [Gammaproteobacteria bacterium]|nr:DUF4129 domain-containing protein [Gammaproteobacteria bacterium]